MLCAVLAAHSEAETCVLRWRPPRLLLPGGGGNPGYHLQGWRLAQKANLGRLRVSCPWWDAVRAERCRQLRAAEKEAAAEPSIGFFFTGALELKPAWKHVQNAMPCAVLKSSSTSSNRPKFLRAPPTFWHLSWVYHSLLCACFRGMPCENVICVSD